MTHISGKPSCCSRCSRALVLSAKVAVAVAVFSLGVSAAASFALPAAPGASHTLPLEITSATAKTALDGSQAAGLRQGAGPWSVFTPADSSLAVPPNHLQNPGFDEGEAGRAAGWTDYGSGHEIDEQGGRGGSRALKLVNPVSDDSHGARQVIELNQQEARPLYFSGYSRADGVTGELDSSYSVYLDIRYADGTPLYGQTLRFSPGTHGWQFVEGFVMPDKPIASVFVYCLLRNTHAGTAWFDDLTIQEVAEGAEVLTFDGVEVATIRPDPAPYGDEVMELDTSDGLAVSVARAGCAVTGVSLGGKRVNDPERAYAGGFFIRDVGAQGDFVHVGGAATSGMGGNRQESAIPEMNLELSAVYQVYGGRISIRAGVWDTRQTTRTLTVYFALPIEAEGWTWGDDIRTSREIEGVREFYNYRYRTGIGANGHTSKYPWAVIDGPLGGLVIAVPLDRPRHMRLVHNPATNQLYAAFDVALSPLTAKFPNGTLIDIDLYAVETHPSHRSPGFRAAARGYVNRFPQFFARRLPPEDEGLWVAFSDLSPIPDIEDFGIRIHELGSLKQTEFDDTKGIYSFRYIAEPWSHWLPINDPEVDVEDYDDVIGYLRRRHDEGERRAEATLSSGTFLPDGTFRYSSMVRPWCEGIAGCAVFTVNPDPDIEDPDYPLNKGQFEWSDRDREAYETYPGLDGEYIDSYSGQGFTLDYRASHFAATDEPLVYSEAEPRHVGIPEVFATTEFARWLTDDVHDDLGKLTMANGMLSDMPWGIDLFEFTGRETNWLRDTGYTPDSDARLSYQRTLSFQKPYGLLMNTWFESFGYELVERYFQTALFYGVYPSMFSHNASEDRYWDDPALYERDRPLFKRYIPLIRTINTVGWRPLTYARTTDERVYVERFGAWPELYFTVRNTSEDEVIQLELVLDSERLGLPHAALTAHALLADTEPAVQQGTGGSLNVALEMPAQTTEVLAFTGNALFMPHLSRKQD